MQKHKAVALSHPQKRVWYTEILYPGTSFANLAGCVMIALPIIHVGLLKKAMNMAIKHYDALRIRLQKRGLYDAVQYFAAYQEVTFDMIEGNDAVERVLQLSRTPFVLIDSDLFYFAVVRFDDTKIGYYFKYHHILCDAMTVSLINQYIVSCYEKLSTHQNLPIMGTAPSFKEFLQRESLYLASEQFKCDEAFWLNEFSTLPEPLNIGIQGKSENILTQRRLFQFSSEKSMDILEFCKCNHTTIFRFFMSVFYIYFTRTTENKDIVIMTGHHNRLNEIEKQMAGMTVSTVPIRICVPQDADFLTLLNYVSDKIAACLSHQGYPYDLLAFNLHQRGFDPKEIQGIVLNHIPSLTDDYTVERYTPGSDPAFLNIKINPNQRPKKAPLEIAIDYHADLFDDYCITQLFSCIDRLIQDGIQNAHKKLYELEMLTEDEKEHILVDFNSTAIDYPGNQCFHELFSQQALKTPDNIALVYQDVCLTYRQLDTLTNQLAQTLRDMGAKPEDCVAIMVKRSEYIVLGAIAVFKAGCAYMPIDPAYPLERINFMLKDGGVRILLSQKELKNKAVGFSGQWLDLSDEANYRCVKCTISSINQLSDLAYVIYTSGSSGDPKGVMVEHGNLTHFCRWHNDAYHLTMEDRQAAYCNFVFDLSIVELFPPLIVGASVYVVSEDIRLLPDELSAYYEKCKISCAVFPTKMGEIFSEVNDNQSLRVLSLGGEKLHAFNARKYRLVNVYGPTEATVYAATFSVDTEYLNIPIGKPIANTWAYVVDIYGGLQPIGVPGELWLAGCQISRGYLNKTVHTKESFIKNPFATERKNERVYKTGDWVRWLPDGNLEFLGRRDGQIKIRGIRIELGEIEQQILRHPKVHKAVVLDCYDQSGISYLSAFILSTQKFNMGELKDQLQLSLPAGFLPALFVAVSDIPYTQNGKTDKKALRELVKNEDSKKQKETIHPKTPTQHKLSQIWSQLLGTSKISITDSFFDLGADSLLSIKLFVRIHETFHLRFPVSILFKENTIEKLSKVIDGEKLTHGSPLVAMKNGRGKAPLFCIHDFSGEVLSYRNLVNLMDEGHAVYGIRFAYDREEFDVSIEKMTSDYIKEIRRVQPKGPYHLIGFSLGGTIAYEMARQLLNQNEGIALLALLDTPNYYIYQQSSKELFNILWRDAFSYLNLLSIKDCMAFLNINTSRLFKSALVRAFGSRSQRQVFHPLLAQKKMYNAIRHYVPRNISGKIILFRATRRRCPMDEKLGWGSFDDGGMDVYDIDGDHNAMMNKVNSSYIASILIDILNATKQDVSDV